MKQIAIKINKKIIDKIRCWLEINESMRMIDNGINHLNRNINKKIDILDERVGNSIISLDKRISINRNTLKNIVEVSTDIQENRGYSNEHSWAIISIGGKTQYVKFVDLGRQNMIEISQFLKRYEAGRHTIDTPHQGIFEDNLYYFESDKK